MGQSLPGGPSRELKSTAIQPSKPAAELIGGLALRLFEGIKAMLK